MIRKFSMFALGLLIPAAAWGQRLPSPSELRREAIKAFSQKKWGRSADAVENLLPDLPRGELRIRMLNLLAESHFRAGRNEKALEAFQRTEKAASRNSYAVWSAQLRQAECHIRLGRSEKAERILRRIKNKSPYPRLRPEAAVDLGYIYLHKGRDEEAERVLQGVLEDYPLYRSDPRLSKSLGFLLLKTASPAEADKFLGNLIGSQALKDEPGSLYLRGMAYRAMRKNRRALRFFQHLASNGYSAEWKNRAHYQMAEIFFQQKMYSLAGKSYRKILNHQPEPGMRAKALFRLGCIALLKGSLREASRKANQVLALAPEGDPLRWQSDLLLAEAAKRDRNYAKAKMHFKKLENVPELVMEARVKRIWILLEEGEHNASASLASDFLKDFQWGDYAGHAILLKGLSYHKGKNYAKAQTQYLLFRDHFTEHSLKEVGTYLLALSYLQEQKWGELVSHVAEAVRQTPPRRSQWQAGTLFALGEGFFQLGRFSEAADVYKEYNSRFAVNALSPWVEQSLAVSYAQLGRSQEAAESQRRALKLADRFSNEEVTRYGLATMGAILFNKRDYRGMLSYHSTFLDRFPDDPLRPAVLYQSAFALRRMGRRRSAVRRWKELAQRYPASPYASKAQLEIGRFNFQAGNSAAANKTLRRLLKSSPYAEEAKEALMLLGQDAYNHKRHQTAIKYYELFVKRYPDDERVEDIQKQLEMSYYLLAVRNRNTELFVSRFPKSPLSKDLYWEQGLAYYNEKNITRALDHFQHLVLDFPSEEKTRRALYLIGEIHFQREHYQEAAAAYGGFLESGSRDPKLVPKALFRMGVSHFKRNSHKEAAVHFTAFLQDHREHRLARDAGYNLILSYQRGKKSEEAVKACRDFLRRFPKDRERSYIRLQQAKLLQGMGKNRQAASAYRRVGRRGPHAMEALYTVAQLYAAQGDFKEARNAYQRLVPLRPKDDERRLSALAMLAEYYERVGSMDKSLRYYREVAALSKNSDWVNVSKKKIAGIQEKVKSRRKP